jgi:hypothetical protein
MKLGKNLNGHLSENVYMEQPDGFQVDGKGHMVCKLKRSIYWLKQASRSVGADIFFLCFYMDDILLAANDNELLFETKRMLSSHFLFKRP